MPYSFLDIINIAKVSTFLSAKENLEGSLFGAKLYPNLPVTLAMETDSVNWIYEYDNTDSTLTETTNYLYSLCGKYAVQAIPIITGSGGGSVTPVSTTGYIYSTISDVVSGAGGGGTTTYYNINLIGGRDLDFLVLNDQVLQASRGDFTFSPSTGIITFLTMTLFDGDTLTIPFNKRLT